LREVVTQHPDFYEIKYSLGLLLAEKERYAEAAVFMEEASTGLPQRSRIQYNLGLLLQKLGRDTEDESALKRALALEANNPDYLYALAVFYLQRGDLETARKMAEKLNTIHPDLPAGKELLEIIRRHQTGS
jgi:Flp pilus assembly protein TadD